MYTYAAMRIGAGAQVSSADVLAPRVSGQLRKWHKGLDFCREVCEYKGMEKALISRNQRRLLDGLCDRWHFDQQVDLAQEIWPENYNYIRKSYTRLQNLGFIEWVSQEQTSYEPRWWVTEKGVRYLLDSK